MNCPSRNDEMQALESLHLSHSNKTCPLAYRPWSPYELKIITDAIAAARSQALQEAREMVNRYLSERHNEWDMAGLAAEFDELCSLAAQPAAAPACPNCGVTGKMSGPGTTTLCMACGVVTG